MAFAHGLFLITVVHLLAAATPGPDFLMVTQQTLSKGKKAGLLCSLGIALGLSVHITYSAFGLAAVIANSADAFLIIKILGGSYLIFLGVKSVRSKSKNLDDIPVAEIKTDSSLKTIGTGFLCNALNPKAPIYFVSLFTLVLSPAMPLHRIVVYGLWIMFLQLAWFSLVATILSAPPISKRFKKIGHYVDRVMGGAMVILGLKVITSRAA